MTKMKHLKLILLLIVVFAWSAGAAPLCTGMTYGTLLATGCSIGDFTFNNFGGLQASINNIPQSDAFNATLAASINVAFNLVNNPDGSNTVSMVFTPNQLDLLSATGFGDPTVPNNQGSFDIRPSFNVGVVSGGALPAVISSVAESITGRVSGNSPTGTGGLFRGVINATENITATNGGATVMLNPAIIASLQTLAYSSSYCFDCGGGVNDISSSLQSGSAGSGFQTGGNLPFASVTVSKDILILAGRDTNNFAALDSLTQQFNESFVPEPGGMILVGTGLLGLSIVLRKRSKGSVKPN